MEDIFEKIIKTLLKSFLIIIFLTLIIFKLSSNDYNLDNDNFESDLSFTGTWITFHDNLDGYFTVGNTVVVSGETTINVTGNGLNWNGYIENIASQTINGVIYRIGEVINNSGAIVGVIQRATNMLYFGRDGLDIIIYDPEGVPIIHAGMLRQ